MRDEGYVKFSSSLQKDMPPSLDEVCEATKWRNKLYAMGLIGMYDDGIGYGNLSIRSGADDEFIITGTATGGQTDIGPEHFTRVVNYDIDQNSVICRGQIHASSESMTHAAVYSCAGEICAVIHIHSADHWARLLGNVPTSLESVEYGTPEMAREIFRLYRETDFPEVKVMAMSGHEEGLLSFGDTLDEAGDRLLDVLQGAQE